MNINPLTFFKRIITLWKVAREPHWYIKEKAIQTKSHPLAGFWQTNEKYAHGIAIGSAGDGMYYISFCGPGGCFKENTYMANSQIIGDENYKVLDNDTIEIRGKKGFDKYKRSAN